MKILKSLSSLIISLVLYSLFFWGLSKFFIWYPSLNKFIFYFLAFWFSWSIRFIPSRIQIIKSCIGFIRTTGYSTFDKIKVSTQFIFLIICWYYLAKIIITNNHLYHSWTNVGFVGFILFIITTSFTIIGSIIIPFD